jgi:hypothetical protein
VGRGQRATQRAWLADDKVRRRGLALVRSFDVSCQRERMGAPNWAEAEAWWRSGSQAGGGGVTRTFLAMRAG